MPDNACSGKRNRSRKTLGESRRGGFVTDGGMARSSAPTLNVNRRRGNDRTDTAVALGITEISRGFIMMVIPDRPVERSDVPEADECLKNMMAAPRRFRHVSQFGVPTHQAPKPYKAELKHIKRDRVFSFLLLGRHFSSWDRLLFFQVQCLEEDSGDRHRQFCPQGWRLGGYWMIPVTISQLMLFMPVFLLDLHL